MSARRMGLVAAVALVATAFLGAPAAQAAGKRVGVPKFAGPQEALIRKRVMQVLKAQGYELVKSREIEAAVQSSGASLDSNDGFQSVAKELALSAFVSGEVSKKKARLTVRNGSDGTVAGEGSFAGANPRKVAAEVGKSFWRRLGSAVERGSVPSGAKKPKASAVAEAPEDNEDAPEAGGGGDDDDKGDSGKGDKSDSDKSSSASASKESDREESGSRKEKPDAEVSASAESSPSSPSGLPWLDIGVGGRGFSRDLRYTDDVQANLRQYKLNAGPAAAVNAAFYPFAISSGGPLSNIGLELDVEQAFGVTSKVGMTNNFANGASFATTVHDFAGGLRYRLPVDAHEVLFSVTGGEHAYAFRSTNGADRALLDLPDTIYRYVRPGVGARLSFGPLSLMAGAGYRYVFNAGGQIKDKFFPHLTVAGIDANIGAAYAITPAIEARLVGDLRRYFYNMHSTVNDLSTATPVAGGAVDQYLSVTLGLAFRLGAEPNHGSSEPASKETALNE